MAQLAALEKVDMLEVPEREKDTDGAVEGAGERDDVVAAIGGSEPESESGKVVEVGVGGVREREGRRRIVGVVGSSVDMMMVGLR